MLGREGWRPKAVQPVQLSESLLRGARIADAQVLPGRVESLADDSRLIVLQYTPSDARVAAPSTHAPNERPQQSRVECIVSEVGGHQLKLAAIGNATKVRLRSCGCIRERDDCRPDSELTFFNLDCHQNRTDFPFMESLYTIQVPFRPSQTPIPTAASR